MPTKRRFPVLTSLPEQGPAPVGGRDPGVALRRREWEAYEELFRGTLALGGPKVVLITGAEEGIRAEVATGLGTVAAVTGRRTLVMECDLARPALADAVGLNQLPGLREYLCWAASAPELLQPVSVAGPATEGRDSAGQLVFVTGGRPASNGAALLAGDGFPAAVGKISKAYDFVVLPTGPLPGPELAVTAPLAEAMLVCLGPAMAGKQGIRSIAGALDGLPENPVGLVVHQRAQRS